SSQECPGEQPDAERRERADEHKWAMETEVHRCNPAPRLSIRRYGARSKRREGEAQAEHQGDRRNLPEQPHRSRWEERPRRLCCPCLQLACDEGDGAEEPDDKGEQRHRSKREGSLAIQDAFA